MHCTLFGIAAPWNCRGYKGGTDRESFFLSFGESAYAFTVQPVLMAVIEFELARGKSMSNVPIPGGRRSKSDCYEERASVVIDLDGVQKMFPCLILDRSHEGFTLRGGFRLKHGQLIELIAEGDPVDSVRCEVIWTGRAGSQQAGEAGLQAVAK
jgi:hypothetical protein